MIPQFSGQNKNTVATQATTQQPYRNVLFFFQKQKNLFFSYSHVQTHTEVYAYFGHMKCLKQIGIHCSSSTAQEESVW